MDREQTAVTDKPRLLRGVPAGGQWAEKKTPEADLDLAVGAKRTDYPRSLQDELNMEQWRWSDIVREVGRDEAERLYQRSGGSIGAALALYQQPPGTPLTSKAARLVADKRSARMDPPTVDLDSSAVEPTGSGRTGETVTADDIDSVAVNIVAAKSGMQRMWRDRDGRVRSGRAAAIVDDRTGDKAGPDTPVEDCRLVTGGEWQGAMNSVPLSNTPIDMTLGEATKAGSIVSAAASKSKVSWQGDGGRIVGQAQSMLRDDAGYPAPPGTDIRDCRLYVVDVNGWDRYVPVKQLLTDEAEFDILG